MKSMNFIYLFSILLCIPVSCNSAQPGCTDPQAINFDSTATEEDGSCTYEIVNVSPVWSIELDEKIRETSGLILWDEALWTMNDDTDTRLYQLNTSTGEIIATHLLPGVVNQDWEEIAQDEDYIYVGDIGNNMGNRKNLHILCIDKLSLKAGNPSIDTIWFTFSDQQNFASSSLNQKEFDCEAFVVSSDSIYLFTKQWQSSYTSKYVLPKLPGSYVAQKREVFNIQGLVTGATYLEHGRLLVLCGYTGLMLPFMHLFYDYQGDDFFTGTQKRVNIALPFHQVEGIVTTDGIHYFLTNEHTVAEPYVNIPQKMHQIDLSELLGEYLKGMKKFD